MEFYGLIFISGWRGGQYNTSYLVKRKSGLSREKARENVLRDLEVYLHPLEQHGVVGTRVSLVESRSIRNNTPRVSAHSKLAPAYFQFVPA